MFLPFDALDVDHHHWLLVREAILGEKVWENSVHFERLSYDSRRSRCRCWAR